MQLNCRNHVHDPVRWSAGEIRVFVRKSAQHDFEDFFGRKPVILGRSPSPNQLISRRTRCNRAVAITSMTMSGGAREKSAFSCENQRNMTSKIFSVERPVI